MRLYLWIVVFCVALRCAVRGCLFAAKIATSDRTLPDGLFLNEGDTIAFTVKLKFLDPRGDTFGRDVCDLRPLSWATELEAACVSE